MSANPLHEALITAGFVHAPHGDFHVQDDSDGLGAYLVWHSNAPCPFPDRVRVMPDADIAPGMAFALAALKRLG